MAKIENRENNETIPSTKDDLASFEIRGGILCKIIRGNPKIYVPFAARQDILWNLHSSPIGGHLGRRKTYGKISQQLWWEGLYRDVEKYVSSCLDCALRKGSPTEADPPIMSAPVLKAWDTVGMDILGPLPLTKNGNRYVLVITDHWSKWVEAFALPDQTADTIAKSFIHGILLRAGFPRKVLTDRGRNFRSELIQEMLKQLQIQGIATASYNPQANGIPERFNRTLADMIAMFTEPDGKDWDIHLPYVVFAYRTAPHAATGKTPFFMNHGREAQTMDGIESSKDSGHNINEIVSKLQEAEEHVRKVVEKEKQERERKYSPWRSKFKQGDLVWLWAEFSTKKGIARKFRKKWRGPYLIARFTTPKTVILRHPGKNIELEPVLVRRLKPYKGPALIRGKLPILESRFHRQKRKVDLEKEESPNKERTQENAEVESEKEDNLEEEEIESENEENEVGEEFPVEDILAKRITDEGVVEWRLKWESFPTRHATWETEANTLLREMKEEFMKTAKICLKCEAYWTRSSSVLGAHKRGCNGKRYRKK